MKFQIYQDAKNEWRWRLIAANNRTIADSGEGYENKADCIHGVHLVQGSAKAEIVEAKD